MQVSSPTEWFNDDAYADNLNPEAVAAFIDITCDAYRREVGQDFGGAARARHDYWRTVSQLFAEASSKQLGERCGRKGLAYTGHYLYEQEMGLGILRGGAIMPHYRYQQAPGIDMLTQQYRM